MKIAILGYAKEGKSTHKYLLKKGYNDISILDQKDNPNYLDNLDNFDIIYKTPGISLYKKELQAVKEKIKTQTDLFFENYKGNIILISGSKGKSTTSAIIYNILKKSNKDVKLIGNIGNPILSQIDFDNPPSYVVFEISSYMLDGVKTHSDFSVLTNIYKVHTKWHQTHENYVRAKLNLFSNAKNCILRSDYKHLLNNIDCKNPILFGKNTDNYFDNKFIYSKNYKLPIENIALKGEHNFLNIASILPICENLSIEQKTIELALKDFTGLEHRQEYVGKYNNIHFYNDSISTIPESILQALVRFEKELDTIIIGGKDENFDYTEVIEKINNMQISNIILLPDSFKNRKHLFKGKKLIEVDNMSDAVRIAKNVTLSGKTCILSPGAPSLNLFKSFEERGDIFKKEVKS